MEIFKVKNRFNYIENLVFGGAGFIGSNLIDCLLKKGQNVICVDNLSSGNFNNLRHLSANKNFQFIEHDIRNEISFDLKVKKIWHLACPPVPQFYLLDPLSTMEINYGGTLNILKLAKSCDSRIFFSSTSEIYGDVEVSPQVENMSINLLTSNPRACYSEGKRIAETLFYTFKKLYNLDIRIARIFNTYGPRLKFDDGRVMSNFIHKALNNEKLTVNGNGSQTRSFCYIDDLIKGMISLMESGFSDPINLGNNTEIRIIDLAKLVSKKTNQPLKLDFKSPVLGEPFQRKPSLELAKKVLNWEPNISLDTGLDRTIDYFKKINNIT